MKRRLLSILCLTYLGLLVYASLMPFDFRASDEAVAARLDYAWRQWPPGPDTRISGSDTLSNFLLYVPLGALLATRCQLAHRFPSVLSALGPALLAGATSGVIEYLQAHSMSRVPSVMDWMLNTAGGLIGAILATIWGRRVWVGLLRWLRLRWSRRPVSIAATVLLILLAADALVPFMPTILLKDVWHGLKRSHFSLATGMAAKPWQDWLVTRTGVYAALTALLAGADTLQRPHRWLRAAAIAVCFAAGLELCKPLIASRYFNIANVAFSAVGCCLAIAVGPLLARRLGTAAKIALAATMLAIYLTYLEWTPFTFTYDAMAIARKAPRGMQWLPLYHYAMGGRLEHARLFVQTIALTCGLTCVLRLQGGRLGRGSTGARLIKAATAMGLFGLALELGQFLLPRVPSVTDVFCFALGGALGALIPLPRTIRLRRHNDTDATSPPATWRPRNRRTAESRT